MIICWLHACSEAITTNEWFYCTEIISIYDIITELWRPTKKISLPENAQIQICLFWKNFWSNHHLLIMIYNRTMEVYIKWLQKFMIWYKMPNLSLLMGLYMPWWRHQMETFSMLLAICACHWPFVWGIHRSPVNYSHKGQWRRALMFSLIWAWINGWVNSGEAGDLRHHHARYDVTVMTNQKVIRMTACSSLKTLKASSTIRSYHQGSQTDDLVSISV